MARRLVNDPYGRAVWRCRCTCMKCVTVAAGNLASGHTKSCGQCLTKLQGRVKHGGARRGAITPEYSAYTNAKTRCRNTARKDFKNYGGRNIRFRFRSFTVFLNALKTPNNPSGLRPSPEHSLDRVNNHKSYQIGNIRWATRSQQNLNRRKAAAAA